MLVPSLLARRCAICAGGDYARSRKAAMLHSPVGKRQHNWNKAKYLLQKPKPRRAPDELKGNVYFTSILAGGAVPVSPSSVRIVSPRHTFLIQG